MELPEREADRLFHERKVDTRKAELSGRPLARAHARFSRVLTALAKIRRLHLPLVVNQVNLGAKANGVPLACDSGFHLWTRV
jgi:hypothetical protein